MYVCICNSSLLGNKVPIDPTKNDLSTLFATYFWCSTAVIDLNWSNILFFTRLYAFFFINLLSFKAEFYSINPLVRKLSLCTDLNTSG